MSLDDFYTIYINIDDDIRCQIEEILENPERLTAFQEGDSQTPCSI